MCKILSLTMIGLASAGFTLATPSSSQAQVPFGMSLNIGPVGVTAGTVPVYPPMPYPVYVRPAPTVVYPPAYPTYSVAPTVVVRPGYPAWGYYGRHHGHGYRR